MTAGGGAPAAPPRRHLAGGILASTASEIVHLAAAAITSIAVARILGPAGTGAFALAATLFAVTLLVFSFGLKQALTVAVGAGDWTPSDAIRVLGAPLLGLGLAGAGAVGVAYALGSSGFLAGITDAGAVAIALAVPAGFGWQFAFSVALARERYEAYAAMFVAPTIAVLAVAPATGALWGTSGALIGFGAGQAIAGAASLAWLARRGGRGPTVETARRESWDLRRFFGFGLKSWGAELLQFVNYRFDLFFLNALATTAAVGIYSVAANAVTLAWVLPQAFSVAVLPRSAGLGAAAERGEIAGRESDLAVARAMRHTVLLLLPSAIVMALVLIVALPVMYGDAFTDAVGYGFVLLPGVLALGLAKVASAVLVGRGQPIYTLYNTLLIVPPTVVLYLIVIPDHGALGASWVSSGSYLAQTIVALFFFARATSIRLRDALLPGREDLSAYREVAVLSGDYARGVAAMVRRRLA